MTCIVAIAQNNKVYMAGDSAAVSDNHYTHYIKNPKVFINGDYLIGYTSSFRMGQLLEFAKLPKPSVTTSLYEFMCTEFINYIRSILKEAGYAKIDNNQESVGNFLVGVHGELFEIQGDLAVIQTDPEYAAIGSGISCSLGSLYSTKYALPHDRLIMALEASEKFTTTVRKPFYTYEN
jgi:ATP-dependent protease HslVU (ClpYQ) peptidase subunit